MEAELPFEGHVALDLSSQDHASTLAILTPDQIAQLAQQPRDFSLFDHNSFDSSSDDMFMAPTTPQTVSPQELTLDTSNPPSSALTNMSTPGMDYEHSPFLRNDSALLTPASAQQLHHLDGDLEGATMFPLFPDDTATETFPALAAEDEEHVPMTRTASTDDGYSATHAAINGVKSRSRSKPLPAIESSPADDVVTAKRKRNTLAARKSREKKATILSSLENEVADLKALVQQWKHKAENSELRAQQAEDRLRHIGA